MRSDAFGAADWGLLALIAGIWGSSFLLIAIGLDAFRPELIALVRVVLGAAVLALVPRARQPIEREDWGRVAVLGVLWMAAPLLLIPIGQQWVSSSVAGMINGSMPLFAALIAALLLRRLPGRAQVAGLLVGFVGVVAIAAPAAQNAPTAALGVGLILLAQVCYGTAINVAVPLQQRYGSLAVVLRAQVVALIVLLPFGLAAVPASEFAWPSLIAVAALGVFGTGVAFVAMATLAGRVGATRGSVAIYFLPVVAIVLGVIFRDEAVVLVSLAGTGLVIAGAWLTSRRETADAVHVPTAGAR